MCIFVHSYPCFSTEFFSKNFVHFVPQVAFLLLGYDFHPGTKCGTKFYFVPFVPGWDKVKITLSLGFVPYLGCRTSD